MACRQFKTLIYLSHNSTQQRNELSSCFYDFKDHSILGFCILVLTYWMKCTFDTLSKCTALFLTRKG